MKRLIVFFIVTFGLHLLSSAQSSVVIIDFVKIVNSKKQEALFFYEHNWKLYRDIALKKGYIKSYELFETVADTKGDFDIILMTEYPDSLSYNLAEDRFDKIIKETSPSGLKLLNELKPSDFRKNVFIKRAYPVFSN